MNINLTMLAQAVAFGAFILFTVKFIWPPLLRAIDERVAKVAEGLKAAETAKSELAAANKRVEQELASVREETAKRLADAERRALLLIEEARAKATETGNQIIRAAQAEAEQQAARARDALREQVAVLAVKGAEQILRREVNANVHADLLSRLKTEF
jgi:F-type H+-transporting ATPase subunit b